MVTSQTIISKCGMKESSRLFAIKPSRWQHINLSMRLWGSDVWLLDRNVASGPSEWADTTGRHLAGFLIPGRTARQGQYLLPSPSVTDFCSIEDKQILLAVKMAFPLPSQVIALTLKSKYSTPVSAMGPGTQVAKRFMWRRQGLFLF